ncbi:MAG TPA: hypothetical protein VFH27_08630 [Longimicrobiaceae bacterium]|nr:hypothetical protein [Longimicrobiaceae bacterium]
MAHPRKATLLLTFTALLAAACSDGLSADPDVTAPVVNLQIDTRFRQTLYVPGSPAVVTGTAADSVGVERVTYQIGNGAEVPVPITPGPSTSFTFSVPVVANGPTILRVRAYDEAANVGNAAPTDLVVDSVAPDLLVSSPAEGGTYGYSVNNGGLYYTVTVHDGLADLWVSVNGGPRTPLFRYGASCSCSIGFLRDVVNGSNTLVFSAVDPAGNTTTRTVHIVVVDRP